MSNSSDSAREREFEFTRKDFDFLRKISNKRTGIVVSDEKLGMFYSRLSRRVRALKLGSFSQYCDLIRKDKSDNEVLELVNAITTNLTSFFRENHHFDFLSSTVLPWVYQNNAGSRNVSIWSAGCSTGEEPYSLSITLSEELAKTPGWTAEILATDIDSNVLSHASQGVYAAERVNGIAKSRMRRWFQRGKGQQEGMVRLKPEVRQRISFGLLNLMDDFKLPEPVDVIFCRNVIIYFDKPTKARLMERFADNLKAGGYLFIGHSESLFKVTDRFELVGNTVYRKIC